MREALHFRDGESITLGYVSDVYELLRAIDETLPKDAVLYLEGTTTALDVRQFLEERQASERPAVAAGTFRPEPEHFHLPLSGTNLAELRALVAEGHAEPELTDHLVVYRGDRVLLSAHDAGYGYVELARSLAGDVIDRFRAILGESLHPSE
ncbi:MAG TPA: hypothetical protein VEG40_00915 [Gaiellaceae bacterium]|nr:hypothetical protein [Gaiellaceae bacterium]